MLALIHVGRRDGLMQDMTAPELDACIRHFGKQLRRAIEAAADAS